MKGFYYSQNKDLRWMNKPYTNISSKKSTVTIGTSACGPTSAAMVLSTLLDRAIWPDEVAEYSLKNGHRVEGVGTAYSLFPALAKEYGLECIYTDDTNKMYSLLKDGYMAVMGCQGSPTALFSTGGHIIALMGVDADASKIIVHDPYLYSTKYTLPHRKNLVDYVSYNVSKGTLTAQDCIKGFDMFVDKSTIDANLKHGFYCMKRFNEPLKKNRKQAKITATVLNIRDGAGTKYDILNKLTKGSKVIITETYDNWAHIFPHGWCSMEYLMLL